MKNPDTRFNKKWMGKKRQNIHLVKSLSKALTMINSVLSFFPSSQLKGTLSSIPVIWLWRTVFASEPDPGVIQGAFHEPTCLLYSLQFITTVQEGLSSRILYFTHKQYTSNTRVLNTCCEIGYAVISIFGTEPSHV